ncbi:MAG: Hpt domain-containing protein [Candidatus Riflebacteria bacterium]|nr:Hpt domain-containing protein [Candidatus Riflebacteria bacterium]
MSIDKEEELKYRKQFYQETREGLDKLSEDLIKAESDPNNPELLNSVFRVIHTIKGSAGGFGLDAISEFLHHLESVLIRVRDGKIKMTSALADTVFNASDAVNELIKAYEAELELPSFPKVIEQFKSFLPDETDAHSSVSVEQKAKDEAQTTDLVIPPEKLKELNLPDSVRSEFEKALSQGLIPYKVKVVYPTEVFENGYDPHVLLKNLKSVASFYYATSDLKGVPSITDFEPLRFWLPVQITIATSLSLAEVIDLAFDAGLLEVTPLGVAPTIDKIPVPDVDPSSIADFWENARDLLEQIETKTIEYEKNNSSESLAAIFRAFHTIKGDSDCVGFKKLSIFAHSIESMLSAMKKGEFQRSNHIIELLLKAVDIFRDVVRSTSSGENNEAMDVLRNEVLAIVAERKKQTPAGSPAKSPIPIMPALAGMEGTIFLEHVSQYKQIMSLMDRSQLANPDSILERTLRRTLQNVRNSAEYVNLTLLVKLSEKPLNILDSQNRTDLPETVSEVVTFLGGLLGETKMIGEILVDEGKIAKSDIFEASKKQKKLGEILINEGKISERDIEGALRKQELMDIARQVKPEGDSESEVRTMRVDEKKIDVFGNMIGELLVAKNTFAFLMSGLTVGTCIGNTEIKQFKDNLQLFTRITNDMNVGVMAMRMVPIKGNLQKFKRVVRDISKKQNKIIDLITDGDETEVDKKVADALSEPLVHIVRNSCDHGIETPEERIKAGKPEKGIVMIRAYQEGTNLIIRILDDGRGMNRKKIYEKAKAKGIPVNSPDDPNILDIVFLPGFSTKEVVSDISGRGVGMDVVKNTICSLGGTIKLISSEGEGSEIVLTIPTKLGINTSLLVESCSKLYAIPFDYVSEAIKLSPKDIRILHDKFGFYYRGEVIPAESLENLLVSKGVSSNISRENSIFLKQEIPVVIIKSNTGKFGIFVDGLRKNMEIAIKPMPDYFSEVDIVNGVTILGDGQIILVLNPEKMA